MGLVGQYFRFLEAELQEDCEKVNPLSPNSEFLLMISIHCHEIRL